MPVPVRKLVYATSSDPGVGVGDDESSLHLQPCPKCRGVMNLEKDTYGAYRECLQCGYLEDIQPKVGAGKAEKGKAA